MEAVRVGTVIATNRKAANRWRSLRARDATSGRGPGGLTGEALERAIVGLARRNPEYVVVGG